MNHEKDARLVSTVTPAVPTFAVYYDDEADALRTDPILFYTVWEETYRKEKVTEIVPIPFDRQYLSEDHIDNFLGLSLTPYPKREEWEERIDSYKMRTRRAS